MQRRVVIYNSTPSFRGKRVGLSACKLLVSLLLTVDRLGGSYRADRQGELAAPGQAGVGGEAGRARAGPLQRLFTCLSVLTHRGDTAECRLQSTLLSREVLVASSHPLLNFTSKFQK